MSKPLWFGPMALALVVACGPAAPLSTPAITTSGPGVADVLARPPAAGESVELDAYFSGAGVPSMPGPPPVPDRVHCPDLWNTALTDRPFPALLFILNGSRSNVLPDDAPWLIAATPETARPGVYEMPALPYHARLRGHVGDPALAPCQHADRIFMVEAVVTVYQEQPPDSPSYGLQLPADYANWPRYHDTGLGYSLPYPPDWGVERLSDVTLVLRSPQALAYPVVVRAHIGETHYDQYDPASLPPLLQGDGFGVFEQGWAFGEESASSQHLSGYNLEHEVGAGEWSASVLFSGGGRTYELALRYPTGFDASQPLLTAYSAIVEGFRLDTPPDPSPTPPVKQTLGPGPFINHEQAEKGAIASLQGGDWQAEGARLVAEAEARRLAGACGTFEGHLDGVWVVYLRGRYEGRQTAFTVFLDAVSGAYLCGEEISSDITAGPTMPPDTPLTPLVTEAPVPTSTPAINPAEQIALYSAAVHHLFTQEPASLGAVAWPVIFVNPVLGDVEGPPTPPDLLPALADLAPRVEFAARESVIPSQSHTLNQVRDGGIWLALWPIPPEDAGEVSLSVEHFVNGLNAAMYDLRLARQGDVWQVIEVKLRWGA